MTPSGATSAVAVGADFRQMEDEHLAHTYGPLEVVVSHGEGAWVTDVEGRRYLDCLAAYSAVNFGHGHPQLLKAAHEQLDRITLTSRAFHNDQLGPFVTKLAALAGKDMVIPMNTGAEAVESGIKLARAWGYRVKGVAAGQAGIPWQETNHFILRRGPYLIAAGLKDSIVAPAPVLTGRFINLFDPALRLQTRLEVQPDARFFRNHLSNPLRPVRAFPRG